MTIFLFPWHQRSRGASVISAGLPAKRILREKSNFVGAEDKVVINWGCSELPDEVRKCRIVNTSGLVARVIDKLQFFKHQATGPARIPEFTEDPDVAISWATSGVTVCARKTTKGRGGEGIVFFDETEDFVNAPLFTKYIPKKEEYRVHFAFGKQIDVQRKVLGSTMPDGTPVDKSTVDWRVRNHASGFIFQRNNIFPPADVLKQAELAFIHSKLHFGAVDVIYNSKADEAYVLEINTSPGIEGATVDSYVAAFRDNILNG